MSEDKERHVVVVGGGLIGTCTAYFVAKHENVRVTVLERSSAYANVTSYANAGRFAVTQFIQGPPASPTMISEALQVILPQFVQESPSSAYIPKSEGITPKPPFEYKKSAELSTALVAWGLWYLRNCTQTRFEYNKESAQLLAARSIIAMDTVMRELGKYRQKLFEVNPGALFTFKDKNHFDSFSHKAEVVQQFGERLGNLASIPSWKLLSCDECLKKFPFMRTWRNPSSESLPVSQIHANVGGGCIESTDWTVDARKFTQAVVSVLEKTGKVEFRLRTHVQSLIRENGRVSGVQLDDGETILADDFVLCMGNDTPGLVQPLLGSFQTLPIIGMQGYTVDLLGCRNVPKVSIADLGSKDVNWQLTLYSQNRVRITGFANFSSTLDSDAARGQLAKEKLLAYTRFVLPNMTWQQSETQWAGLRPMSPDNLPMIGKISGYQNVYVNCGQGSLGWTMSAASGSILADAMFCSKETLPHNDATLIERLSPNRFSLSSFFGFS